jgi:3-hydroxybutyryl-CoA dehydrogenase
MGAGIAQIGITGGFTVILFDVNGDALKKAGADIAQRLNRLVEKGQMAQDKVDAALGRLKLADSMNDFAPCDIIIEAIIERLEVKQELFKQLEGIVSAECVLASNTSSLAIAAIARPCKHRERICGMHFFNPVPLMKLVEIIRAPATNDRTAAMATDVGKRIGKTTVNAPDVPGFLVNLGGRAYSTEALHIRQEQVADVATIDRIMRDACGFRMGPLELMDLTGIDVNFPATMYMYTGWQHDPRLKTTTLHESLYNAGLFGRKAGQGYHTYQGDSGAPASPPAPSRDNPQPLVARVPEHNAAFDRMAREFGLDPSGNKPGPVLIAPMGEDAATACVRLSLDPANVVAMDFIGLDRKFITLMRPLGGSDDMVKKVEAWLTSQGFSVAIIKDSPGFVAPRMIAAIANLGCEMAQIGIASPQDIDLAMKLGLNYPRGPLEWADYLGPATTLKIVSNLQAITGSDRYRPSLWLRRRAQLSLPIHTPD